MIFQNWPYPPQKPTYPHAACKLMVGRWNCPKKKQRYLFRDMFNFPEGGVDNLILNWNTGHLKTLHLLLPTTNGPENFVDRTWMSIQESTKSWRGYRICMEMLARLRKNPKKVFGWGSILSAGNSGKWRLILLMAEILHQLRCTNPEN